MTTKILALTDALGNLVRFVVLPGHRYDTVGVPPLIDGVAFSALIADKAFDQANPTLPAVAMAARLAHHIHRSLCSVVHATILRARPPTEILPPSSEIAQGLRD
ncbi:hypothetical protein CN235_21620 [Sinorhizobium meliloti]|nr:hypothetical protein CN235_21620 [Sinorhizobium meliloti]